QAVRADVGGRASNRLRILARRSGPQGKTADESMRSLDVKDQDSNRSIGPVRCVWSRAGNRDVQIMPSRLPQRHAARAQRRHQQKADSRAHGYSLQLADTISKALIVMRCSSGSLISKPRTYILCPR